MKRFTVFLVMSALLYGGILTAIATEWPQWRGPNRDGVSGEVGTPQGVVPEWSQSAVEGPAREGFSGISVSQGRVYTMFSEGNDEFVVCLDATDGR